jgi:hypothetical protein
MKIQNLFLSALAMVGLTAASYGQSFQSTIYQPGMDYNHYSIETTPSGEYVCAGTLFDAAGRTDIHILKLDPFGNIIWETLINESDDDRALDLVVDANDDIVVTGYISPVALNWPELYVVKLDGNGNFIADSKLQHWHAAAGTNIIEATNGSYIVGGFYAEPLSFPLVGNEAIVVEFDPGLNYITHNQFSDLDMEHSSINDIVEIPTVGYFLTGSVSMTAGYPTGEQGVLALIVDTGLNLTNNLSFEATNWEHIGVSVDYDSATDELILMSNNSYIHNPQITVFQNMTTAPSVSVEYYLELDPTYGSYNAAGFDMEICDWDPNTIIASGYFRTYDDGSGVILNACPWIVQFEKSSGAQVAGHYWPAPSPNFHTHGGGVLSTFSGEHPYVFNQEIMTLRADAQGYVFVGPREVGANFGIDVVTTIMMDDAPCFEPLHYDNPSISSNPISLGDNFTPIANPMPNAPLNGVASNLDIYCPELARRCAPIYDEWGIVVQDCDEAGATASINDFDLANFTVAPNPFQGNFTVEISGENLNGHLILINALGQTVYTSAQIGGEFYREQIEMESFEKGIYILKFTDGNSEIMKKIVKL